MSSKFELFNGNSEVIAKKWNGVPVVSLRDVKSVHGLHNKQASSCFSQHKNTLKEGKDYFRTTLGKVKELENNSFLKGNPNNNAVLLTESGYNSLYDHFVKMSAKGAVSFNIKDKELNTFFDKKVMAQKEPKAVSPVTITKEKVTETPSAPPVVVPNKTDANVVDQNAYYKQQLEFMQRESLKNEEFRNTMMESFSMLAKVIANQSDIIGKFASMKRTKTYMEGDENQDIEATAKTGFAKWKRDITKLIGDRDVNAVMSAAYKYMTKTYGIVWEEAKKDYIKANGGRAYSNMEVAYWLETTNQTFHNLTSSCIETLLKEA